MKRNMVAWFEIYVDDMVRAKNFYEAVFMQKLERVVVDDLEMWMFPWVDNGMGAGGALVKMEEVKPGVGGTMVHFSCDDCAVEQERVLQHGGRVHMSKFSIGENGFVSLVFDTEGNMIGLHSMK